MRPSASRPSEPRPADPRGADAPRASASTRIAGVPLPATRPLAVEPTAAAAVDRLAADLASDDWRTRERARATLVAMGGPATEAVERLAATSGNDETRAAARAVLRQIAEDKRIGTSYVTLHLAKATPRKAFEALAAQAGTVLKAFPDEMWEQFGQPTVHLDVDRQPFWVAMRDLCRQTGIDLTLVDGKPRLTSTGGGSSRIAARQAAVAGAFLIVPVGANLSRSVTYEVDDPPVAEDFSIQFLAFPEPKLNVLRVTQGMTLREAVDDKGNSLLPEPPKADGAAGQQPAGQDELDLSAGTVGDGSFMLHAQFRRPKEPGGRLVRLRGTVGFQLQVESQTIEVRDLLKARDAARTVNGTRVVFHDLMRKDKEQYLLRLTAYATPDAAGWEEFEQSMHQRMKVLDESGQALDAAGADTTNAADGKVEMTLTFTPSHRPDDNRQSGEPTRLTWDVPTKTRDVIVPFEIRDLKLP